MQAHARLANVHPPQLHTHDRFGRRIDEVEFHPSYHALMAAGDAARACTARRGPAAPASHMRARRRLHAVHRARAVGAVPDLDDLRGRRRRCAATRRSHADWGPQARQPRATTRASCRWRDKAGADHGHGHDREAGRLRRARQHHAAPCPTAATPGARAIALTGHKWFFSAPMCDAFLVLAQAPAGLTLLLPAALCCPTAALNAHPHPAPEGQARQQGQRELRGRVPRRHAPGWSATRAAACRRSWRWAP